MQPFFHFLATNPYILLFVTVGMDRWNAAPHPTPCDEAVRWPP